MKATTNSPITDAIQKRFFQALDQCIKEGKVSSIMVFCKTYGFSKKKYYDLHGKYSTPPVETEYKQIDLDAIYYLAKDFNVPLDYIFMGSKRKYEEVLNRVPKYDKPEYGKTHAEIPEPDRLKIEDASKFLGVSIWQVYNMCNKKLIPFGIFGHATVFSKVEITKWKNDLIESDQKDKYLQKIKKQIVKKPAVIRKIEVKQNRLFAPDQVRMVL